MVMHDGSRIVLRKSRTATTPPTAAPRQVQIQERMKDGEYLTGLLLRRALPERVPFTQRNTGSAAQQHPVREAVTGSEGHGKDPGALSLNDPRLNDAGHNQTDRQYQRKERGHRENKSPRE